MSVRDRRHPVCSDPEVAPVQDRYRSPSAAPGTVDSDRSGRWPTGDHVNARTASPTASPTPTPYRCNQTPAFTSAFP